MVVRGGSKISYIEQLVWQMLVLWMVHKHYKLICCYLCSAEQNNKTSLKSKNEWFIFMTESRLLIEWEKALFRYQVAVSQVVRQFFSVLQVVALVLLCV